MEPRGIFKDEMSADNIQCGEEAADASQTLQGTVYSKSIPQNSFS